MNATLYACTLNTLGLRLPAQQETEPHACIQELFDHMVTVFNPSDSKIIIKL